MSWIFFAIFAFFLFAITSLIDKLFLRRHFQEPVVYSFFIGLLSIGAIILIPFGFEFAEFKILAITMAAGAVFFAYLFVFFIALSKEEASRVIPSSGAFITIFTLLLSRFFLKEYLTANQIFSVILLIIGGVLINIKIPKNQTVVADNNLIRQSSFFKILPLVALATFMGACSFVLLKYSYSQLSFINAFIWSRFGIVLASLLLLIPSTFRLRIKNRAGNFKNRIGASVVGNKTLAGIAALLMNLAISKGSVTVISAISGVQHAFVFILSLIFFAINPAVLQEEVNKKVIIQKVISILIIAAGLATLAL